MTAHRVSAHTSYSSYPATQASPVLSRSPAGAQSVPWVLHTTKEKPMTPSSVYRKACYNLLDDLARSAADNRKLRAEIRRLRAEIHHQRAQREHDALDGQAALDEANNELVRLKTEAQQETHEFNAGCAAYADAVPYAVPNFPRSEQWQQGWAWAVFCDLCHAVPDAMEGPTYIHGTTSLSRVVIRLVRAALGR